VRRHSVRRVFRAFILLVICSGFFLVLSGCEPTTGTPPVTSDPDSTTATLSANWGYSASSPVEAVSVDTLSLTVTGLPLEKVLYLAKINPTALTISGSNTRYVSSTTGLSSNIPYSASKSAAVVSDTGSAVNVFDAGTIKNFVPPQTFGGPESFDTAASLSRGVVTPSASVTQISPVAGTTTKSIYIDKDSTISTFAAATATCEAVGTYCYVWVVNDYLSAVAVGDKVNQAAAKNFADKFDAMYPLIRTVFGDESDEVYYKYNSSSGWSKEDIALLSDTGTKVNIVIYDIGGGDGRNGSIVGYFYAKDYYPDAETLQAVSAISYQKNTDGTYSDSRAYSNEGKYFYIDSYFVNTMLDTTCSTLAHEFQHMIDWNTKSMTQSLYPSTWYNEMLSMLCEDMMQSRLGIEDSDSPKGRLPAFCQYYRYVGLEYNSTSNDYTVISYAAAYAFGAWCARQFGGAALVSKISQNNSVDTASVVSAINSINNTGYTLSELLKMYAEACVFNTSDKSYTYPTYNQNAAQTLTYSSTSYAYPMTAVNLWDKAYKYPVLTDDVNEGVYCNEKAGTGTIVDSGGKTYDVTYLLGPALYPGTSSYCLDIRPFGFTLHQIGTASSDTVTITFSSVGASDLDMYIFVQ
jgi:hypothetical protein